MGQNADFFARNGHLPILAIHTQMVSSISLWKTKQRRVGVSRFWEGGGVCLKQIAIFLFS